MCLCNATCPFFSSVSRSARLRLLYVHARTHLSRVRHERPSLSLSLFSFCLRFSGRALVARVRALAVTLCSFVSVSTSAESEVSDTDARSRIASFVYASRSMTVRWRIGEPWSWSSRIYSRNVRAPVNAGHVIPERDITELPRVCQWRVARRQWWWTDAWKLFYVHVERWCKYGWKLRYERHFLRSKNIEYPVASMWLVRFSRIVVHLSTVTRRLNVLDENECQPLFSN